LKLKKFLGITLVLSLVTIIFISSGGLVSAFSATDASVEVISIPMSIYLNGTTTVRMFFNSNFNQALQIEYVGIHCDWMANASFAGFDVSSSPITISAEGKHYLFNPINISAPATVTTGDHSYYVTIDGIQGDGSSFTWQSPDYIIHVYATEEEQFYGDLGVTFAPTTSSPEGGGNTASPQSWPLIVAVIAVVAIVIAVTLLALEMRKKQKKVPLATESQTPANDTPASPTPAADEPVKNIEE
jgi:hypothetical protein